MVPSENRQALVDCLDDSGNVFATILFAYEGKENDEEPEGSEPLLVISAEEAAKQGTAPVQLRESCRYSYEIKGVEKERPIELEPNRLISRYKNIRLLETRASAARLHLHLTEHGKRVATGIVEIRSVKLDYLALPSHKKAKNECLAWMILISSGSVGLDFLKWFKNF